MTIKTEHYISGSTLGPIQCSQGGVPYNSEHIDHWKQRALSAETKLSALQTELTEQRDENDALLDRYDQRIAALKAERDGYASRLCEQRIRYEAQRQEQIDFRLAAERDWQAQFDRLKAERDAALEAFRKYGNHRYGCPVRYNEAGYYLSGCTCGYADEAQQQATSTMERVVETAPPTNSGPISSELVVEKQVSEMTEAELDEAIARETARIYRHMLGNPSE